MKQEAMQFFTDTYLTIFAMLLFFSMFAGVLWWVTRKSKKAEYEMASRLPLMKENGNE